LARKFKKWREIKRPIPLGREIRGGHSNNKIKPKKQKAVGPTMTIMVSLPTVSLAA